MQATLAELYGKGIFTTVAIRDARPLLWAKHWNRLFHHAAAASVDISDHPEPIVSDGLAETISRDRVLNGRARITFLDRRPSGLWPTDNDGEGVTSLTILTGPPRPVPSLFKLTISAYPINSRSPLAGVKSCNYLENILSKEEAEQRGFHEAVRLNERGHVTSGCMSNIFWEKGGELFTAALSTGCLAGTTREYVLENVNCSEVECGIDELDSADAIFLTSAGLGIAAIDEFNARRLAGREHPILGLWPPASGAGADSPAA